MPLFESSRKVQVFGSSLAMTLPSFFVKANEVEKGSVMKVLYGLEGVLIVSLEKDPEVVKKCLVMIMDKLEEKMNSSGAEEGEKDG